MSDFEKKLESERPRDLHFQCDEMKCAAHESWIKGAEFGKSYALKEICEWLRGDGFDECAEEIEKRFIWQRM